MEMGNKIKELRTKLGITQEELSKTLNVSSQAVSKWENGGLPDLELIPEIAKYFNVTTDYLFDIKQGELVDIEKKLYQYIRSLKLDERTEKIFNLGFLMSAAYLADTDNLDIKELDYKNLDDDYHSQIINKNGIIMTSLAKDNLMFTCFPKNELSNYSKMLQTKDKQRVFCEYLSDEKFYVALILLYSRDGGKFTEKLLVEKMNITSDKAKDILTKLKEFNLVCYSKELLDDDFVELYETCPNPHLVGLVAFLNMVVDRPNCFYYYAGGSTQYFTKKGK